MALLLLVGFLRLCWNALRSQGPNICTDTLCLLLLLSAFPLAVACNVVRVSMLVALANQMGLGLLDTPFHAASGVLTFWAVLAVMILIADRNQLRSEAG